MFQINPRRFLGTSFLQSTIIKKIMDRKDGFVSILTKKYEPYQGEIEAEFTLDTGEKIPVFKHYRHSLKIGWRMVPELNILAQFEELKKLSKDETKELHNCVSHRTITRSLESIREFARPIMERNRELFIDDSLSTLRPSEEETKSLIKSYTKKNLDLLEFIKRNGIALPAKRRLLEIGFSSGGHSLFAFEKLGYLCSGIDNCYDGLDKNIIQLPKYLASTLNSRVRFKYGDICSSDSSQDKSIDIITSTSVLEHIDDLRQALSEMHRRLADDGIMIHSYGPFHGVGGAHCLGNLDSPWGHLRLSEDEFDRYLREFRPHEFSLASPWNRTALNKKSISEMQSLFFQAGFKILLWRETASPQVRMNHLTGDLLKKIMVNLKNITLSDLFSQDVLIVAKKM